MKTKNALILLSVFAILTVLAIVIVKQMQKETPTPSDQTQHQTMVQHGSTTSDPNQGEPAQTNQTTKRQNVLESIRRSGKLRVGFEPESQPMYWKDEETGQYDGFDYQLALIIAKDLGVGEVIVVEDEYSKLPDLLLEDKADIILNGYIPDPSIKGLAWSTGYLDFGFCLIVRKGSAVRNVDALTGDKIGIYEDEAAKNWVEENIGKNYQTYEDVEGEESWLHFLKDGQVDAIIYDYPFAKTVIEDFPELVIVQTNLNDMQYSVGMPDLNHDLLTAVNDAIKNFVTNNRSDLVRKYLKAEESSFDVAPIAKGTPTYVVKPGDVLSKIAEKVLGSSDRWREIWDLNKHRIPNPDLIMPGDELIVPQQNN